MKSKDPCWLFFGRIDAYKDEEFDWYDMDHWRR